MTDCVFCGIVEGTAAADIVARDAETCAFLDRRPLFLGHVLVVPLRHVETLADLPPEGLAPIFSSVRCLARAIPRGLGADGTLVVVNNVVSQSVSHLHVHVVPRKKGDGLRGFFWPRQKYASDEERAGYARAIRDALAADS